MILGRVLFVVVTREQAQLNLVIKYGAEDLFREELEEEQGEPVPTNSSGDAEKVTPPATTAATIVLVIVAVAVVVVGVVVVVVVVVVVQVTTRY